MQLKIQILITTMFLTFNFGCPRNNLVLRHNSLDAHQTMKDLRAAEESYKSKKTESRYGALKDLVDAGLIERDLLGGVRHGYRFEVVTDGESYSAVAVPLRIDDHQLEYIGESFFLDETGIIRGNSYGKANNYMEANGTDEPVRYQ